MEILGIFSHPVVVFNYPKLESSIHDLFIKEEINYVDNVNNKTSENDIVLDNIICDPLKQRFLNSLNEFKNKILSSDVDLYITESWLNFTNQGGSHHAHYHPNSIISGVYYYNVSSTDSISFQNPFKSQYDFVPKNYNIFNSPEWTVEVKQDSLVLFMSSLSHYVKETVDINTRKSLAFNTFFKGELGVKRNRTYIRRNNGNN